MSYRYGEKLFCMIKLKTGRNDFNTSHFENICRIQKEQSQFRCKVFVSYAGNFLSFLLVEIVLIREIWR